jgi:hypothetical protein
MRRQAHNCVIAQPHENRQRSELSGGLQAVRNVTDRLCVTNKAGLAAALLLAGFVTRRAMQTLPHRLLIFFTT